MESSDITSARMGARDEESPVQRYRDHVFMRMNLTPSARGAAGRKAHARRSPSGSDASIPALQPGGVSPR